jgi:regulator of protease activity HflC (stomatin/prohibitin superfamily)
MMRAIARQAEAERERRAKVIHAEGELQARRSSPRPPRSWPPAAGAAAALPGDADGDRSDKNSTIVFPLPMDLLSVWIETAKGRREPPAG